MSPQSQKLKIKKNYKYTFPIPDWTTMNYRDSNIIRVYSIFDKDILVCYADIIDFMYSPSEKYQRILTINCIETNPKYRKKGYAYKILTTIIDEFPNCHFVIEPVNNPNVHNLYAKLGFSLLYYDGGYDIYTLFKLAKNSKHTFAKISNSISKNYCIEPCFFFDCTGVKWDNEKKIYPGYDSEEDSEED